MKTETIKEEIKRSYGAIAKGNIEVGCCNSGSSCCARDEFSTSMKEDYSAVNGYEQEADLNLGCGLPTEIADIKSGDTVVDLGSGAGNDAFIARSIVGESGKVIGIDMTPEMVIRALQNTQKLGYTNVEFLLGEIENMKAIAANTADVVVSNCVMNLVPDKAKAFAEVHRILKEGGHFSISDIVYSGTMPDGILKAAELYAGCIAGAVEKGEYMGIIKTAGFKNIQIKKERKIELSDELLLSYISKKDLEQFKKSGSGIYSITVYADKLEQGACCESSGSGCCGFEEKNNDKVTSAASACCGSTNAASKKSGCC